MDPRAVLAAAGGNGEKPGKGGGGGYPPAAGGACGIVVAALASGDYAYVLNDASVTEQRPEQWARAAVKAAEHWQADRVIAEVN